MEIEFKKKYYIVWNVILNPQIKYFKKLRTLRLHFDKPSWKKKESTNFDLQSKNMRSEMYILAKNSFYSYSLQLAC